MNQNDYRRRLTIYVLLVALCTVFHLPRPLAADAVVCLEPDDAIRARTAYVVAGATVVGLLGAAAYILCRSGSHCDCYSSSSSCSSSGYSSYSHSCSSGSSYSRSCSSYRSSKGSCYSSGSYSYSPHYRSAVEIPQKVMCRAMQHRGAGKESEVSQRSTPRLSASFLPHPVVEGRGSATAFVRLPDGTTHLLGKVPVGGQGGAPLHCGPFEQKGSYTFGLSVDPGTLLPREAKIGSLRIEVEGVTVDSGDFVLPPNPPANYEPSPHLYSHSR